MSALHDFSPISWREDTLFLLDQTLLPGQELWLPCREPEDVADAIRRLAVRGAPAIGIAAAYGLVLGVAGSSEAEHQARFEATFELLAGTRPTAVNLRWALEQGRAELHRRASGEDAAAHLLAWARRVQAEDFAACRQMGDHGATLFGTGTRVLTHCNAGALATAGYGTAIGVITSAFLEGKIEQVWVDETRPLLQGARLTAWELGRLGIPHRLVTDSSVGALMSRGLVDRVVVGADRIARNGDAANKIGTYTVAVLAARHGVPFYVAAPRSTVDLATPSGAEIPIEERAESEVKRIGGVDMAPEATKALNFAFDVTPHELIAAIITEVGVHLPPYEKSLSEALA